MKLHSSRRATLLESTIVDLTESAGAPEDDSQLTVDQAHAFYRANAEEIVARMRKPSTPTKNLAAVIVAQCETDPRLRAEALCAVDDARRARDALSALNRTMDVYAPMRRV